MPCCVTPIHIFGRCFPSNFAPIFVPRDKDVSNCEGSADLHHSPSIVEFDETSSQISCHDVQSSSELSIPKSPPALLKGSVTTLNMDVLEQTVLESQKSLQTASQEAEEATKLCHQREQKRNAAKAALEMARIKHRQ